MGQGWLRGEKTFRADEAHTIPLGWWSQNRRGRDMARKRGADDTKGMVKPRPPEPTSPTPLLTVYTEYQSSTTTLHATTTMPHVYKDVPASQLHQLALLDRSPVQIPANTAAHTPASTSAKGSPNTSRCSTPIPQPGDRTPDFECMTIPPLSILMNHHGFADIPFTMQ